MRVSRGGSPIVTHAQHPKNGSQGAKRPLTLNKPVLPAFAKSPLKPPRSEDGVWGLESRARCVEFSVTEIKTDST